MGIFASKEQRAEKIAKKQRKKNEHTVKTNEWRRTRSEIEKLLRMEYIQDSALTVLNELSNESKQAPNDPGLEKKYQEARDIFNSVPYIENLNKLINVKYNRYSDLSHELWPGEHLGEAQPCIYIKVDIEREVNTEFSESNNKNWIQFRKNEEFFLEFDNRIKLKDKIDNDIYSIFAEMMKKSIGKSWILNLQEEKKNEVLELLKNLMNFHFVLMYFKDNHKIVKNSFYIYSDYKKDLFDYKKDLLPLLEPTEPKNYVSHLKRKYSEATPLPPEILQYLPPENSAETPPPENSAETPPPENSAETPPPENSAATPPLENSAATPPSENPAVRKSSYSRMHSRKSKRTGRKRTRKN